MDGLDMSAIDQDVFNGSPMDSDEDNCDLPLPDCIGIDSAVQDDEQVRLKSESRSNEAKARNRTEKERELELKLLKPDSIRRQIFEQSIKDGNNKLKPSETSASSSSSNRGSHVMNIIEKAGMSGIDKERINGIIHQASKGSLFYKKQAQRQAEIHKSIEKMLNRVKAATPLQVENARITCDKLVIDLEKQRAFNKIIVHFDLDMFFAAVEIRDNPELKDKPVAVGGDSMVSTSNYIARRYGVRAAMPGFIARKLCPDLLLIKPNGVKYRQASSEVFSILEQYDPELTSMSLDEAYLDLTDYVKNTLERDGLEHDEYYDGTLPKIWWTRAGEIVEEIRQAISEKTKLTCSAGIACNTLLSKISTDINKPDGQFMVEGYPKDVIDFISKTPVEKVSGIGKVSAQFLNALDIKTCGDIFEKRHFLPLVFYEINVRFYLGVSLGDGSTSIKSDEQRKSKSVERTFTAVKDTLILLDKLDNICEELCTKYLKPYRIRGRTVTVKLKRNTFTTTTKSYSMLVPTNDKLVIYSAAKNLLLSDIANEPAEISYRLLGVKLSNLADDGVATNQLTIDAMLRNQELSKATKSEASVHKVKETSQADEVSRERLSQDSDFVTQDGSIHVGDEPMVLGSQDHESNTGSQKRQKPEDAHVDLFSRKRSRHSESGDRTDRESPTCSEKQHSNPFFSQEDDEEFFDANANQSALQGPNELSQREQRQNQPNQEDFQCPYCFKPFCDFTLLENHVETCFLKIPIDVNKSFFSQRSQPVTSPSVSSYSKTNIKSRASQSMSAKKARSQRQSRMTSFAVSQSSQAIQALATGNQRTNELAPKLSFYQKFIQSNSESLSQTVKVEPFQCPYCRHGFLSFNSLETHVVMCTKKKNG